MVICWHTSSKNGRIKTGQKQLDHFFCKADTRKSWHEQSRPYIDRFYTIEYDDGKQASRLQKGCERVFLWNKYQRSHADIVCTNGSDDEGLPCPGSYCKKRILVFPVVNKGDYDVGVSCRLLVFQRTRSSVPYLIEWEHRPNTVICLICFYQ